MPSLLWTSYFRYLRKNLWLFVLSVTAVAVGVAVVLAVELASVSAKLSFALSMEALTGRSNFTVSNGSGRIPSDFYRELRVDWGFQRSAPVLEGYVNVPVGDDSERTAEPLTLTLLGIDPFADKGVREWTSGPIQGGGGMGRLVGSEKSVVASAATARRLDWVVGQERKVWVGRSQVPLRLAGTFEADSKRSNDALENVLLADLSVAQVVFDKIGWIDRIDLVLEESEEKLLRSKLPQGYFLNPSGQNRQTAGELSSAFHVNLRALSHLCLLVAAFLIFNVVSFSVSHRRQSLARLRILGVTSRELAGLLMGEALVLGTIGGFIGCILGLILGRGLVPLVTRTLNDLYYVHSITGFSVDPKLVMKGFLSGLVACFLASLVPTYLAAREEPLTLLHRVRETRRLVRGAWLSSVFGVFCLLMAAAVLRNPSLTAGLVCLLLIVVGYSLCVPIFLHLFVKLGGRLFHSLPSRMALGGVSAFLERTSVAAVSLTVAVAATISIALMVSSFRATLATWLDTTLVADVYLSLKDRTSVSSGASLPLEKVEKALNLTGVRDWVGQRSRSVNSSTGETLLVGVRGNPDYVSSLVFLESVPGHWERFVGGEGVFVTEPYSRRAGLSVGDKLTLTTPSGSRDLEVLGVYYSYAPDRNLALVDYSILRKVYDDAEWSGLGLFVKPGTDHGMLVSELRGLFGDQVQVRATGSLKRLALEIFERTFTVTEVLRILALGVAFMGVFISLLALSYERSQEVRVLRALGFSKREFTILSVGQSLALGVASGLFSLPLGVVLSQVMISVINRRAFGWTIAFEFDSQAPVLGFTLAVLASLAAGFYPAQRWARESVEEVLTGSQT